MSIISTLLSHSANLMSLCSSGICVHPLLKKALNHAHIYIHTFFFVCLFQSEDMDFETICWP